MATLEEIQAEIARRQNQSSPDLAAIQAEIAKREQPEQGALSSAWDATKQAFKGNGTLENAGNIHDYINTMPMGGVFSADAYKLAASDMFGNTEDVVNRFKKVRPDIPVQADANGNPYFEVDGKQYYFNEPGLDVADVVNFGGEAAAYTPAVRVGGAAASTFGKAALTGAGTAATNAGLQKAAGRDEIDTGESLAAGAMGGAFEVASPYMGKLFGWAKGKLTGSSQNIAKGAEIAQKAGIDLPDDAVEVLGKMRNSVDDAVPDDALIAELKHGLKLTRGQATGSIKQLSREAGLRNQTVLMDRFKQVDDLNRDAVESNLQGIRKGLYDGVDDALQPTATAETALDGLKSAARESKTAYQQAYKNIDEGLAVRKNNNLVDDIKSKIDDVITIDSTTPKTKAALEDISNRLSTIDDGAGVSIKDYENLRRRINTKFSGQMDSTDKKALTMAKDELDNWFYKSVDDSLLSGSPEQLEQLQKARGLMTDYMNRFQSKEKSKKVITNILNDDVTPEEFSNMITGVNGYSKQGAANAVKAYKSAVGADSEAFKALQANVFEKLVMGGTNPRTGDVAMKGYEGLIGTFNQAFNRKGTSMMKELFDNKTALEIKSLMKSVGKLVTPQEVKNASGSARLGAQILSQSGARFPILSNIYRGLRNLSGYSKAATKPAKATSVREAGGLIQAVDD